MSNVKQERQKKTEHMLAPAISCLLVSDVEVERGRPATTKRATSERAQNGKGCNSEYDVGYGIDSLDLFP